MKSHGTVGSVARGTESEPSTKPSARAANRGGTESGSIPPRASRRASRVLFVHLRYYAGVFPRRALSRRDERASTSDRREYSRARECRHESDRSIDLRPLPRERLIFAPRLRVVAAADRDNKNASFPLAGRKSATGVALESRNVWYFSVREPGKNLARNAPITRLLATDFVRERSFADWRHAGMVGWDCTVNRRTIGARRAPLRASPSRRTNDTAGVRTRPCSSRFDGRARSLRRGVRRRRARPRARCAS